MCKCFSTVDNKKLKFGCHREYACWALLRTNKTPSLSIVLIITQSIVYENMSWYLLPSTRGHKFFFHFFKNWCLKWCIILIFIPWITSEVIAIAPLPFFCHSFFLPACISYTYPQSVTCVADVFFQSTGYFLTFLLNFAV